MAKRTRLGTLSGLRWATGASVEAILARLEDEGQLAEGVGAKSRRSISRAMAADIATNTPYGPPIQPINLDIVEADGTNTTFAWDCVNPFAYLAWLCHFCPAFFTMLQEVAERSPSSPSSPWRLLFYTDELSPGNLLRSDNTRKSWAFYFSFLEIPASVRTNENCWFLGGILRTSIVSKVPGGLSGVWRQLMRAWFGALHNFATTGCSIVRGGGEIIIYAVLHCVLSDESAIKHLWNCKGSAGIKPCLLCRNLISSRSGLLTFTGPDFVDLACTDTTRFQLHSDESIWACIAKLREAANSTRAAREKLEIVLGFSADLCGILYDEWLRDYIRPTTTTYDWMHVFLVNGIAQLELWLFLSSLPAGRHWPDLNDYTTSWHWPSHIENQPTQIWNDTNRRSSMAAGRFKCGASDMLNLYGIIRCWTRDRQFADSDAGQALLLLFKVLDALASHPGPEKAQQMMRDICMYIEAHKRAHGVDNLIPKFHMSLHLPAALARMGELPACFVHERQHKTSKKYGTTTARLSVWEKSVTSQLLNQQLETMGDQDVFVTGAKITGKQVDATDALRHQFAAGTITAAAHASCNGVHSSRGDMVYVSTSEGVHVARVRCHIKAGLDFFTMTDAFERRGMVWVPNDRQLVTPLRDILGAAIWRQQALGFEVIEPPAVAWP